MNTLQPLLQVKNLVKHFPVSPDLLGLKKRGNSKLSGFDKSPKVVRAVDGISFDILPGETLGLAGESGCGKTTTGRLILRLIPATSGEIYFDDSPNLLEIEGTSLQPYRRQIQIIFQDPFSSLNPRMTVEKTLSEPIRVLKLQKGKTIQDRVVELLEQVGLSSEHLDRYPHEFSGGQRQRIGIARALTVEPRLIICDEPVSALDVSIQAQIINLLQKLQKEKGLSYLFVAHNLSVVEYISQRVAVMYLGKIIEMAPREEIFQNPMHPYTQLLLEAVPIPDPLKKKKKHLLEGDVPSPVNPPPGCRFHTRCPKVMEKCKKEEPIFKEYGKEHKTACFLHD